MSNASRYCTAAMLSHHVTAPRRCSLITLLHRSLGQHRGVALSSRYCTAALLSHHVTAPRRCSHHFIAPRRCTLITLLHRGDALSSLYCTGHAGSTAALLSHHFIAQVTRAAPRRCSLIFNAAMPGDGRTTRHPPLNRGEAAPSVC